MIPNRPFHWIRRAALSAAMLFLCIVAMVFAQAEGEIVQRFEVRERFGVRHPEQIIDFDLIRPVERDGLRMVDGAGNAVAFQLLDDGGKVAVRAALEVGETKRWTLMRGPGPRAEAGTNPVTVERTGEGMQISNGLTGVRVSRAVSGAKLGEAAPAPLQAFQYRDGHWSTGEATPLNWPGELKQMRVEFLEEGPLRTVVQITYEGTRSRYRYGRDEPIPAGPSHYAQRVTVEAGQPSVMFEEHTDNDVRWSLSFGDFLPRRARFRGHNTTDPRFGRTVEGERYRPAHTRKPQDAIYDLSYEESHRSHFRTGPGRIGAVAHWNPWASNTGWYWQFFNPEAGPSSPLVGLFAGRASRVIGPGQSHVGLYTKSAEDAGGQPEAGLTMRTSRRRADARYAREIRFQWRLFVGEVGEDLADPLEVQPIARQMNLHSGFNLDKLAGYVYEFPPPPQGYGAMFMSPEAVERMKNDIAEDEGGPHGDGRYGYYFNAEPYARPLVSMWADEAGEKAQEAYRRVVENARDALQRFIHHDGIYAPRVHYWHGGNRMTGAAVWIDQLLSSQHISEEQKRNLEEIAGLYANMLYDDDWVPLHRHMLNLGTPNMPVMQRSARNLYTLLLTNHPVVGEHADRVAESARSMAMQTMNEHGAHMGSVHYVGAAQVPLMTTMQQLQMSKVVDLFAELPRMRRFGHFYLDVLTPPEPRFNGLRKMVAIGDGSTEGSIQHGMLGTAMAGIDPEFSKVLMGAWRAQGRRHGGMQGTSLLKINEYLPGKPEEFVPDSATYPGWYTVLREAGGTDDESAAWVVNGAFYRDHWHQDMGGVVLYALSSPLSVDWGPIYYPRVAGAYMHSLAIPERMIGQKAWDGPVDLAGHGGRFWTAEQAKVLFMGPVDRVVSEYREDANAEGPVEWRRTMTLIAPEPDRPIILIEDTYGGEIATEPKVFTLNLMSRGPVQTPAGAIEPKQNLYRHKGEPKESPSGGTKFELPSGTSRLDFTGRWGIDWALFTTADGPRDALLDHWSHDWHPSPEQGSFRRANDRSFEETQHILRIRGNGPFHTVIVPWKKGEAPNEVDVTREGGTTIITNAGWTVRVAPDAVTAQGPGGRALLAALSDRPVELGDARLAGGPAALRLGEPQAQLTIHGPAGERTVTLPPSAREMPETGEVTFEYDGGEPASHTLPRK